ncbi:succinate--CoA ligase subunit alpha (plasmid) [Azospirillum baldaniorum]|uniref:Succinyl-CoA synthetase, alpha subunit,NAD(P)-binding n=1 Tax=Azospirillum baldaniorum TaxID=1064539 RepID=A0A9P1NS59_9PROT|nr:CoA-binding protein [Azospirillum baldaniorum]AWJ94640.1 succinate--CoA ligase subunit alpha [Azospirillum baldaniorum]TWA73277.1 succinyl-CoA synthetase alpha subunit [Azospirillum brasilense]CCD03732.1 succinyl-CoA synthetase, alpha subunit,NAD(P)-binding [Azospirillum baldaniorum]
MIVRKSDRVLVQGITGKQGTFWTEQMQAYGTTVVGGVNPKKAGQSHCGVPIFATAKEAMASGGFDVSVMFIPPAAAKAAAIDAIEAGAKTVVCLTEHIPSHDVMEMHAAAAEHGTRIIGPNTAGIVTPGEGFVGIMPAFNPRVFQPGRVGVISRSGSLGTLVCLNLVRGGHGQSAFLGIGGDPMIGTTTKDALAALIDDPGTDAIALVGEIGGSMEEEAAELVAKTDKPVVSFIAGRASPPGKKMGHAGAIVTGDRGSYASKRGALERAGAVVVDVPGDLPAALDALMAEAAKRSGAQRLAD